MTPRIRFGLAVAFAGAIACLGSGSIVVGCSTGHAGGSSDPCKSVAQDARKACQHEAKAEYWVALGKCENLPTKEERDECRRLAKEEMDSALEDCADQYDARLEVCDSIPGAYDPFIDPTNFATTIDNPYFPLTPGTTFVFEKVTEEGTEHIEVTVTDETREILGVSCVVVRDTATFEGELIEDTWDWYAQDLEGNVWYFGELTYSYENGQIAGLEGSWEAGVDGAKPGIVMEANPEVEDTYRQEFLLQEAEDVASVLALGETATVPYGNFDMCVKTADFSALEPDVLEHKYYAPGVGVVLAVDVESGEREELIDIQTP